MKKNKKKKYLVFDSVEEAVNFVDDLNNLLGFPKDERTISYTSVIRHLSDYRAAVLICPICHSSMSGELVSSTITTKQALIEGFFKQSEDL